MDCPKCGYPYVRKGPKKGTYKGIYTPGKKCDMCGYRDERARVAHEAARRAAAAYDTASAAAVRVTTRQSGTTTERLLDEVALPVDHDLQLHWPDGSLVEISTTLRSDGYLELRSYTGRMLVLPLAGNALALRPEARHSTTKSKSTSRRVHDDTPLRHLRSRP